MGDAYSTDNLLENTGKFYNGDEMINKLKGWLGFTDGRVYRNHLGDGICAVCAKEFHNDPIFMIPIEVFVSSKKLKHWMLQSFPDNFKSKDDVNEYMRKLGDEANKKGQRDVPVCTGDFNLFLGRWG